MNHDLVEFLQGMEARLVQRLDRHEDAVDRKLEAVHGRIVETNKRIGETREEFAAHKGRMAGIAAVVGVIVSGVVSLIVRMIPNGGGQ